MQLKLLAIGNVEQKTRVIAKNKNKNKKKWILDKKLFKKIFFTKS